MRDPLLEDLECGAGSTAVCLRGELGDEQSSADLERLRRTETDSRLAKKARSALKKIRSRKDEDPAAKPSEAAAKLEDLEERIEARRAAGVLHFRGGAAGAATYTFKQPGVYAYVNHNLIEALLKGAAAHFKVDGIWDDDLMMQVKKPSPIP